MPNCPECGEFHIKQKMKVINQSEAIYETSDSGKVCYCPLCYHEEPFQGDEDYIPKKEDSIDSSYFFTW